MIQIAHAERAAQAAIADQPVAPLTRLGPCGPGRGTASENDPHDQALVHVCFSFKVGNTPHTTAMRSMELMIGEVRPRIEKALGHD